MVQMEAQVQPTPAAAATRRRGDTLRDAILAATLDELATAGFAGLSIEHVAERARTGKASVYRRWPSRLELVLEALDRALPQLDEVPDTGSIRADLCAVLRQVADVMSSRGGDAARACFSPGADVEVAEAIRGRLLPPRQAGMLEILQRGVARGEVRAAAVTPRIAEVGPMLLHAEVMLRGRIDDGAVVEIVDDVLMPLLRP